jgi:hypothetical protein
LYGEGADQSLRRIDELITAAVAKRDVERAPLVVGRLRLDGPDRLAELLWEPREPAEDPNSSQPRSPTGGSRRG